MLHPLLNLIVSQPQLLAEHAVAYAELVSTDVGTASTTWKRRAAMGAAALCCAALAAVLGGVAVMLWAVIPAAQLQAPWALLATPLVPLAVAVCLWAGRGELGASAFAGLRRQVQADLMLLREVSVS